LWTCFMNPGEAAAKLWQYVLATVEVPISVTTIFVYNDAIFRSLWWRYNQVLLYFGLHFCTILIICTLLLVPAHIVCWLCKQRKITSRLVARTINHRNLLHMFNSKPKSFKDLFILMYLCYSFYQNNSMEKPYTNERHPSQITVFGVPFQRQRECLCVCVGGGGTHAFTGNPETVKCATMLL
jgi:hypothetical protein